MIDDKTLLTSGYSKYSHDFLIPDNSVSYQKEIRDKIGIMYYINCKDGEEFEAILINPDTSLFTVNIKYWKSLHKIEKCIYGVWKSCQCRYIERFEKVERKKYRQIDLEESIERIRKENAQK